jgi:integrase
MAFLTQRADCSVWYIGYQDDSGRIRRVNTGIAIKALDSRTMAERALAAFIPPKAVVFTDGWSPWVIRFIERRFNQARHQQTRARYQCAWANLHRFFTHQQIGSPKEVAPSTPDDYIDWRRQVGRGNRRPAKMTTIGYELRFLALALNEAIRQKLCTENFALGLGISRRPEKRKPEITHAQERQVRAHLEGIGDDNLLAQFIIAIRHGTRLRATRVHLERDVEWARGLVTFHEKGSTELCVPLNPEVRELLWQRKRAGQQWSCEVPRNASKRWKAVFTAVGMPEHSFHCCRVTVISRLHRRQVPEAKIMAFVGHSSVQVHRTYCRVDLRHDLNCCIQLERDPASAQELGSTEMAFVE